MPRSPTLRHLLAPLAAALLAAAPTLAAPPTAAPPPASPLPSPDAPERYALPNGLTVALSPDRATTRVSLELVFAVGSRDDPPNRRMMAPFLAELFAAASTRHLSSAQRPGLFLSLGIEPTAMTATTRLDDTRIAVEDLPAEQLPLYLWLLGDRLGFWLDGLDDAALREGRAAVDKAHLEALDRPYGVAGNLMLAALYGPGHPYSAALDGDAADLGPCTPAEIRERARARYTPRNAALVVTGGFAPAAVRGLVEKYFGVVVGGPPPPERLVVPPVTLAGERRLGLEAGVSDARLLVTWPTAPFLQPDDLALDVVSRVLSIRLDRRLHQDGNSISKLLNVGQLSRARGSAFTIGVTLAQGHAPDEALRIVDEELDRIRAADVPQEELAQAIRWQLTNLAGSADLAHDRARRIAGHWGLAGDTAYLADTLPGYRAVSAASLRATVGANLPAGRRLITVVVPARGAPPGGRVPGGGV